MLIAQRCRGVCALWSVQKSQRTLQSYSVSTILGSLRLGDCVLGQHLVSSIIRPRHCTHNPMERRSGLS